MNKLDKIRADLCYTAKLPFTFKYDLSICFESYWQALIKKHTLYYEPNVLAVAVKLIDYKAHYVINNGKKYKIPLNIKADSVFDHYLKLKPEVSGYIWVENSQLHFKEGLVF